MPKKFSLANEIRINSDFYAASNFLRYNPRLQVRKDRLVWKQRFLTFWGEYGSNICQEHSLIKSRIKEANRIKFGKLESEIIRKRKINFRKDETSKMQEMDTVLQVSEENEFAKRSRRGANCDWPDVKSIHQPTKQKKLRLKYRWAAKVNIQAREYGKNHQRNIRYCRHLFELWARQEGRSRSGNDSF